MRRWWRSVPRPGGSRRPSARRQLGPAASSCLRDTGCWGEHGSIRSVPADCAARSLATLPPQYATGVLRARITPGQCSMATTLRRGVCISAPHVPSGSLQRVEAPLRLAVRETVEPRQLGYGTRRSEAGCATPVIRERPRCPDVINDQSAPGMLGEAGFLGSHFCERLGREECYGVTSMVAPSRSQWTSCGSIGSTCAAN